MRRKSALSLRDVSSAYPSSSEGEASLKLSAQITHTIGQLGTSCSNAHVHVKRQHKKPVAGSPSMAAALKLSLKLHSDAP